MRSNYAYFPELPFDGKEMFVKLQIVLNNGNHIKAESVLPYILYFDQVVRLPWNHKIMHLIPKLTKLHKSLEDISSIQDYLSQLSQF